MISRENWETSTTSKIFSARYGVPDSVELLSNSNNIVWKVNVGRLVYVVKNVSDRTVEPEPELEYLKNIGKNKLFREILSLEHDEETGNPIVVYPYIQGTSLDNILVSGNYTKNDAMKWSSQLLQMFEITGAIRIEGWGNKKKTNYETWFAFFFDYLEQQKAKAPKLATLRYEQLLTTVNKYRYKIEQELKKPTLVSADVNTRNYIVSTEGELICIHTPMLWHADPSVCFGEALVHLDSSSLCAYIKKYCPYPVYRTHLYAAFNAYVILAYVERFSADPIESALPWGGKRPLMEILDYYLAELN